MPIIYRHIVPHAPQRTGNGAVCYRGRVPAYQRAIVFAVRWIGTIDFSPFKTWWDASHPDDPVVAGQTLPASDINDAWDNRTAMSGLYCGVLGNSPCAYGNLPTTTLDAEVDGFSCDAAGLGSADSSGGESGYVAWNVSLNAYLEWDATQAQWRWIAPLVAAGSYNRCDVRLSSGGTASARFGAARGDVMTFASAYTTERLRIGNMTTLYPLHYPSFQGGWAAEGLANCQLELMAQWS